MAFTREVLDEILKDYHGPDDFTGRKGSPGRRSDGHLGYEKHNIKPATAGTARTPMEIEVLRDREESGTGRLRTLVVYLQQL